MAYYKSAPVNVNGGQTVTCCRPKFTNLKLYQHFSADFDNFIIFKLVFRKQQKVLNMIKLIKKI